MTPLERAEQAIREVPLSHGYEIANMLRPEEITALARAVLAAIREPSEGMKEEGAGLIPCAQGVEEGPLNTTAARDCWQAMIDAALAEGE